MKTSELTNKWEAQKDKYFSDRIGCGDTPDEAMKAAIEMTRKHFTKPDPRGDWDSEMECYIPRPVSRDTDFDFI